MRDRRVALADLGYCFWLLVGAGFNLQPLGVHTRLIVSLSLVRHEHRRQAETRRSLSTRSVTLPRPRPPPRETSGRKAAPRIMSVAFG